MTKGKEFELAVWDFVKRLAPDAKVYFDHRVKDRDTGSLRQVDVWVETRIANHFPISILISCKNYKRKVNISHIGSFINEVISTGAGTGVIYSKSGFTKPAMGKAVANGLNCCRLYENQPADIPDVILFYHYLSKPTFRVHYFDSIGITDVSTWGDLFDLVTCDQKSVYNVLVEVHSELTKCCTEIRGSGLPRDRIAKVKLELANGASLAMGVELHYKHYKGKLSAHLVRGSYCLTNGAFVGNQYGPVIDTQSIDPGPGWEEIEWTDKLPPTTSIAIFTGGSPISAQIEMQRKQPISIHS